MAASGLSQWQSQSQSLEESVGKSFWKDLHPPLNHLQGWLAEENFRDCGTVGMLQNQSEVTIYPGLYSALILSHLDVWFNKIGTTRWKCLECINLKKKKKHYFGWTMTIFVTIVIWFLEVMQWVFLDSCLTTTLTPRNSCPSPDILLTEHPLVASSNSQLWATARKLCVLPTPLPHEPELCWSSGQASASFFLTFVSLLINVV